MVAKQRANSSGCLTSIFEMLCRIKHQPQDILGESRLDPILKPAGLTETRQLTDGARQPVANAAGAPVLATQLAIPIQYDGPEVVSTKTDFYSVGYRFDFCWDRHWKSVTANIFHPAEPPHLPDGGFWQL